jgi:hypothetical protein
MMRSPNETAESSEEAFQDIDRDRSTSPIGPRPGRNIKVWTILKNAS